MSRDKIIMGTLPKFIRPSARFFLLFLRYIHPVFMKRITIKDLARHLLLSTSTVSRALINDAHIHPETKAKVLDAARELGYKRNPAALNLKYGQSKNIGLVVPEMVTPFSSKVLRGIQNILYPLGYRIIITESDEDPVRERENLLLLEEFNVDGIIINLCDQMKNQEVHQQLLDRGIPLVFFDRIPAVTVDAPQVRVDDAKHAAVMVEHLISTGKRRIVHLKGPGSVFNSEERAAGYTATMQKYGIYDPLLLIEAGGLSFEHGKKVASSLLRNQVEFDGIFAFTDTLAIGAMNFLLEKQVRVPQDVSVSSFSGTELATMIYPPLTSVEPPLVKMGEVAASLVLEKIANIDTQNKVVFLDAALKVRSSTQYKSAQYM